MSATRRVVRMSSGRVAASRGWQVSLLGLWGFLVFACASPAITGAVVVSRGHRVPQSRELGHYEVLGCRDAANQLVTPRQMAVRFFASSTGYSLLVERVETNTLWFERGTAAPRAFHFQAVISAPGGAPRLWDFRLPTDLLGTRGTLVVASDWTEHGDSPHVPDVAVRRCELVPVVEFAPRAVLPLTR
jgi:hypothetical protein